MITDILYRVPTKNETVKTTQINDDLKLDFWFLYSIKYFDGLLNN